MPYINRIKALEENYTLIENQISAIEKSENPDKEKLSKLYDTKNKYLVELRDLRRAQYDYYQEVDLGDDR
jgi:hypothetical protein